ncbi:MAG: CapA family protein [Bdellovibrio sp.]|nr:CapA family protein [Bdellovibrio sp.]
MKIKSLFFTGLMLVSVNAWSQLTLTMGGDVNFNKNLFKTSAVGFLTGNGNVPTPWANYVAGIKPMIDGDLNFANIETVISERNDLPAETKAYVFHTHPNAIQQLIDVGFNLFNLANNHAYDYGFAGINETLNSVQSLKNRNPQIETFGLGYQADLLKPVVFQKNGYTIAVASVSIIDKRFKATNTSPGLIHIWSQEEYRQIIKNMKATSAHYKILSIHFGTEGQVALDNRQKEYYEYAIKNGVDLIIGHHPHAVRPIQKIGNKYIFYSLGNYLMLGSANITGLEGGADFGLFAKLHLVLNSEGRLQPEAVQLTALTNTHSVTKPLLGSTGQKRLAALNALSESQIGREAFTPEVQSSGQALFCETEVTSNSAKKICPPR